MKTNTTAAALAILSLSALLGLGSLRGSKGVVRGDEGTYLAMAESLALDGDLTFGESDRRRLEEAGESGRQTVILQRAEGRVAFSKPALYPLLAAPFVRALGLFGTLALNGLAMAAALLLGWGYLARLGPRDRAALAMVTFAGTGVLLVYVAWAMSDALQAALALAGAALALGGERPRRDRAAGRLDRLFESPAAPAMGGALLGLLTALRYPNALLALAVVTGLALAGRARKAVAVGLLAALAILAMLGVNRLLTGAMTPYKAERASFNSTIGYPAGGGAEAALGHFETGRATHSLALRQRLQPVVSAYSGLYFLVGRHTGALVYFPAALLVLAVVLRRPDRLSLALLGGVLAVALFYLLWIPDNYFGGATFVGNRYFLPAYAVMLVALPRLPRARAVAAVWLLAVVVCGSAILSARQNRGRPYFSQSHAGAGIFRLLPIESTAAALEGLEDRIWSDEFLRFWDTRAEISRWGFQLAGEGAPALISVAHARDPGLLRFVVFADRPDAELVYRDRGGEQRVSLAPGRGGSRGVVEMAPGPTWRRHPMKWRPGQDWFVRPFTLAIDAPGAEPVTAEIRYLGPYRLIRRFWRGEPLQIDLPAVAAAGTTSAISVRARNTGSRPWATHEAVPIQLSYELRSLEAERKPIVGPPASIRAAVPKGEVLEAELRVRWPRRPGRYQLVVDLVLGGAARFEEWTGQPLAAGEVLVEAAPAP